MAITMTYPFGAAGVADTPLTTTSYAKLLKELRSWARANHGTGNVTTVSFTNSGNVLSLQFGAAGDPDKLSVMNFNVGGPMIPLAGYNHPTDFEPSLTNAIDQIQRALATDYKKYITPFIFLTSEAVRSDAVRKLFVWHARKSRSSEIYGFSPADKRIALALARSNQDVRRGSDIYSPNTCEDYFKDFTTKDNGEYLDRLKELSGFNE